MSMEAPSTTVCSNCNKPIPSVNFTIHEIHCKRNNVKCDICHEVVNSHDLEKHKTLHNKIRCECGQMIEQRLIDNHKQNECTLRIILCKYCEIEYKAKDLFEHEDYCGNRTEFCPVCQKYIKLRDFQTHEATNCAYPPPPENPEKSRLSDAERRVDQIRSTTLQDFFYLPNSQPDPLSLKCPNCNESFQFESAFESHIAHCMDDRILTISEGEVDCIPCEICNALISISDIEDHQIQCRIASEKSLHDEYEEMFHQTSQKRSKVIDGPRNNKNPTKSSPVKPVPAKLKKSEIIVIDDDSPQKSVPSTRVSRLNGPPSTRVATRKPTVPTTTTATASHAEPSLSTTATRKPAVPTTRTTSDLSKARTTSTTSMSATKLKTDTLSTKTAVAARKKPTPLTFKPITGLQGKSVTVTKKPSDNV